MKSILYILLIVLSINQLNAQEDILVYTKEKPFSFGQVTAFSVLIPEADLQTVQKAWTKYLKKETKAKTEEINGEIYISRLLEKIAPDSIHISSYLKEYDGYINVTAAFNINGNFVSPEFIEEVYLPAKKYVRDFAITQYQNVVVQELKQEEKQLNKLNNELKSLYNQEDNLIAQINNLKREIVTANDEIKLNEIDQSSKVLQIQAQKEVVYQLQTANDEEALKNAEKLLKDMEKDFDKLQKENKNYYKKIDNNNISINQHNRTLDNLKKEQKLKQFDIEEQEIKVRRVNNKLNNIN